MSKGTKAAKQGKKNTKTKIAGKGATKPAEAAVSDPVATEAKNPASTAAKPMSCLDAASAVLKASSQPMGCKDMVNAMFAQRLPVRFHAA